MRSVPSEVGKWVGREESVGVAVSRTDDIEMWRRWDSGDDLGLRATHTHSKRESKSEREFEQEREREREREQDYSDIMVLVRDHVRLISIEVNNDTCSETTHTSYIHT